MPRVLNANAWAAVVAVSPMFFALYEDWAFGQSLYRIDPVAGAGTATELPAWAASGEYGDGGMAIGSSSLLSILASGTNARDLQHSGDAGASWSETYSAGADAGDTTYNDGIQLAMARSYPLVQWIGWHTGRDNAPPVPANFDHHLFLASSDDGGATWGSAINYFNLSVTGKMASAVDHSVAVCEDGTCAYGTVSYLDQADAAQYRFYRVLADGTIAFGNLSTSAPVCSGRGFSRPGYPDTVFFNATSLPVAYHLMRLTWSTNGCETLTVPWGTDYWAQWRFGADGTLYAKYNDTFYRSADGGDNWTVGVDLTTFGNPGTWTDQFAISGTTLVVAYSDGTFGISTDQGDTWVLTDAIGWNLDDDGSLIFLEGR